MQPALTDIRHPVWMCGFRPFFVGAVVAALIAMLAWLGFLLSGWPLPAVAGGPFVWHAHELLFGFALAATAGFLLPVVPEFVGGGDFPRHWVRRLFVLWLLARVAFWTSGWVGMPLLALSGLAHLALLGGLAWLAAPRLWRDPERKHLAFLWAIAGLALCVGGFYADALTGAHPTRWLYAAVNLFMMLILVVLARISMRLVNFVIEEAGIAGVDYRARPPRRNLAIVCIGLFATAEFALPGSRLSGWLALAAAAAILNLLNDWHIGRVLLRRWALLLYLVLWMMAAGYALMGLALVFDQSVLAGAVSAGRHLLAVGVVGTAIFSVMSIAGRVHCGRPLDEGGWIPAGASLLLMAALARAGAAWPGVEPRLAWGLAGTLWCLAFGLYAWRMTAQLAGPRDDGRQDCQGVDGL